MSFNEGRSACLFCCEFNEMGCACLSGCELYIGRGIVLLHNICIVGYYSRNKSIQKHIIGLITYREIVKASSCRMSKQGK